MSVLDKFKQKISDVKNGAKDTIKKSSGGSTTTNTTDWSNIGARATNSAITSLGKQAGNGTTVPGNVLTSLGSVLPGWWGAAAAALGTATNFAFGVNDQPYQQQKSNLRNQQFGGDADSVTQQLASMPTGFSLSNSNYGFLQRDKQSQHLRKLAQDAFDMNRRGEWAADNVGSIGTFNQARNITAYGGPIGCRKDFGGSLFGYSLADPGTAIGYQLATDQQALQRQKYNNKFTAPMFSLGGGFSTDGSDFTNGLIHVDAGGVHETNPYEGVPMGTDGQGSQNLVEEGETVYRSNILGEGGYVFSERLTVPEYKPKDYDQFEVLPYEAKVLKKYGGKTFAAASKLIEKDSYGIKGKGSNAAGNGAQDEISKNMYVKMMEILKSLQEQVREEERMKQMQEAIAQMSPEQRDQMAQLMMAQAQQQQAQEQAMQQQAMQEQAMQEQGVPQEAPEELIDYRDPRSNPLTDGRIQQAVPQEMPEAFGGPLFGLGGPIHKFDDGGFTEWIKRYFGDIPDEELPWEELYDYFIGGDHSTKTLPEMQKIIEDTFSLYQNNGDYKDIFQPFTIDKFVSNRGFKDWWDTHVSAADAHGNKTDYGKVYQYFIGDGNDVKDSGAVYYAIRDLYNNSRNKDIFNNFDYNNIANVPKDQVHKIAQSTISTNPQSAKQQVETTNQATQSTDNTGTRDSEERTAQAEKKVKRYYRKHNINPKDVNQDLLQRDVQQYLQTGNFDDLSINTYSKNLRSRTRDNRTQELNGLPQVKHYDLISRLNPVQLDDNGNFVLTDPRGLTRADGVRLKDNKTFVDSTGQGLTPEVANYIYSSPIAQQATQRTDAEGKPYFTSQDELTRYYRDQLYPFFDKIGFKGIGEHPERGEDYYTNEDYWNKALDYYLHGHLNKENLRAFIDQLKQGDEKQKYLAEILKNNVNFDYTGNLKPNQVKESDAYIAAVKKANADARAANQKEPFDETKATDSYIGQKHPPLLAVQQSIEESAPEMRRVLMGLNGEGALDPSIVYRNYDWETNPLRIDYANPTQTIPADASSSNPYGVQIYGVAPQSVENNFIKIGDQWYSIPEEAKGQFKADSKPSETLSVTAPDTVQHSENYYTLNDAEDGGNDPQIPATAVWPAVLNGSLGILGGIAGMLMNRERPVKGISAPIIKSKNLHSPEVLAKPVDRNYAANRLIAQGNAANRMLSNLSAGNSGRAMAGIMANNANTLGAVGDANYKGWVQNEEERLKVAQMNINRELEEQKMNQQADLAYNDNLIKLAGLNANYIDAQENRNFRRGLGQQESLTGLLNNVALAANNFTERDYRNKHDYWYLRSGANGNFTRYLRDLYRRNRGEE